MPSDRPCVSGHAFVDAARIGEGHDLISTFAIVSFGDDRLPRAAVVGRCLGWVVTPAAAEGWGALQAARAAEPGAWTYSDSRRALDMIEDAKAGTLPRPTSDAFPIAEALVPLVDGGLSRTPATKALPALPQTAVARPTRLSPSTAISLGSKHGASEVGERASRWRRGFGGLRLRRAVPSKPPTPASSMLAIFGPSSEAATARGAAVHREPAGRLPKEDAALRWAARCTLAP